MNNHIPHASFKFSERLQKNLTITVTLGIFVSLVGVVVAPARTLPSILLSNYYLLGLGLSAAMFIAFLYVSNAGWATAIRCVPEAMTSVLPVSAVVMIALLFGAHTLYEWTHESVVAHDRILQSKSGWLNLPFFAVRTILYLALWLSLTFAMVKASRKQDSDGSVTHTLVNRKWAAAFIVVFSVSFTLASFDWIMSLQPHWFSTIFAIYNFTGMFVNGLATMTIVVILLRRWGPLAKIVSESHLHDLGKLIFAFSTFWMYIWFSQYMLIWYANIPEEARFFTVRMQGGWLGFSIVNVVFNWVIPFLALLPIWTKKNEGFLFRICIILMVGHWIDLFWMVMPPFMKSNPIVFAWELAPMTAAIAGFFLLTFKALAKHSLLPTKDPYLMESLAKH